MKFFEPCSSNMPCGVKKKIRKSLWHTSEYWMIFQNFTAPKSSFRFEKSRNIKKKFPIFFRTRLYAKKLLLWLNSTIYICTCKIISNPVHWPTDFWTSWPCQFNKNGSNLKGNRQMFCIQSFCQIYKFLIKFRNFVAFLTNNQEAKGIIETDAGKIIGHTFS